MDTGAIGVGIFGIILVVFVFIVLIAIARWMFRINDIVERLDRIAKLLEAPIPKKVAPPHAATPSSPKNLTK